MALICHCEAVKDRAIVKAVHRGARTLDEVQAACGAATRCGGCEPAVLDLIARHADQPVNVRPAFGFSA